MASPATTDLAEAASAWVNASGRNLSELTWLPFAREEQAPQGDCVRDLDRALDNATFALAIRRLAHRFESLGVSSGDTIAVMLPNCSEIITSMFAAWFQGAAMTPVNPALTDDEVR